MNKRLLLLSILLVSSFLALCQDKNAYIISGKFSDTINEGEMVYLQIPDSLLARGFIIVDSARVKDSKFKMQGIFKDISIAFVSVGMFDQIIDPATSYNTMLVLEPGDICVVFDKKKSLIGGSLRNVDFNKTIRVLNKFHDLAAEIEKVERQEKSGYIDANATDMMNRAYAITKEMNESMFLFAKSNMQNKIGTSLLTTSTRVFSNEQIVELLSLTTPEFRNKPRIKEIEEQLASEVIQK